MSYRISDIRGPLGRHKSWSFEFESTMPFYELKNMLTEWAKTNMSEQLYITRPVGMGGDFPYFFSVRIYKPEDAMLFKLTFL